jgi:hypothetical protein
MPRHNEKRGMPRLHITEAFRWSDPRKSQRLSCKTTPAIVDSTPRKIIEPKSLAEGYAL